MKPMLFFPLMVFGFGCDPDIGYDPPEETTSGESFVPYSPPPGDEVVDASTLTGKMVMGYQGWFSAPGDGSERDAFRHWFSHNTPRPENLTFDAWPDLSELSASELFDTELHHEDGRVAQVYSAHNPTTVDRHFQWMAEHRIDGVFLQQFVVELTPGSNDRAFRDQVTENVRAGAEAHGRVFALMYDLSSAPDDGIVERIIEHWESMVDSGVVHSDRYLQHRGRPLVAIWGLGFAGRSLEASVGEELLTYFRTGPTDHRATIMGGVPTHWRSRTMDAAVDPAWTDVILNLDVISPWTVGRFADDSGVENYRHTLDGDLLAAAEAGADLLPVIWPGFSWANLNKGEPLNQIPRRGGRFLWKQVYESIDAGATMLYGSMFDEVDEATAFFKIVPYRDLSPADAHFLALDADGEHLPSDFYLQLAGAARDILVGDLALAETHPITSGEPPTCDPPRSTLEDDHCTVSCGEAGGDACGLEACGGHFRFSAYDCDVCCDTSL
jgi:hypothetical protein